MRPPPPLLAAALTYAARGIPVLPLHSPVPGGCSCHRPGCDRIGKHPRIRRGLLAASTARRQIRRWWRLWPAANIGLVTGVVADVCDIDGRDGLEAVHAYLDGLVLGPVVRTGSGGRHLWLLPTGHGNRARMLPEVDWRGHHGFVVAPPSLHATGRHYTWLRPLTLSLPACPPALLDVLAPPRPPRSPTRPARPVADPGRWAAAALRAEAATVATAPEGARNDTLNRSGFVLGQIVGADLLAESTVAETLAAAARGAGLGDAEIARTLAGAIEAGRRYPRSPAGG